MILFLRRTNNTLVWPAGRWRVQLRETGQKSSQQRPKRCGTASLETKETLFAPAHEGASAESNNVSFDFTNSINYVFYFTAGVCRFSILSRFLFSCGC